MSKSLPRPLDDWTTLHAREGGYRIVEQEGNNHTVATFALQTKRRNRWETVFQFSDRESMRSLRACLVQFVDGGSDFKLGDVAYRAEYFRADIDIDHLVCPDHPADTWGQIVSQYGCAKCDWRR